MLFVIVGPLLWQTGAERQNRLVRSRACTCDFSSTHSTMACSGGFRYRPTMSRTFSTSHGSVDSLNVPLRCGCSPKLRQMRTTALWLSPTSFARDRVLHWVAAADILSRVR